MLSAPAELALVAVFYGLSFTRLVFRYTGLAADPSAQ